METSMKTSRLITALFAAMLITGCTSEPSEDLAESIVKVTPETAGDINPKALFDPSDGVIPFPNNLLFSGTKDGTLNIPVDDSSDFSDPQVALNTLDGFSTTAPISSEFSTSIDSASVNADSVKVYQVTLSGPGGAVVVINSQLSFGAPGSGADYFATLSSVDTSQSTLAILPLKPLPPQTSYMVAITDDLETTDGRPFDPSVTYLLIKNLPDPLVFGDPGIPGSLQSLSESELASFEQLRQIINVSEATVAAADGDVEVSDIINSWSFTTQSISDVLDDVRNTAMTGTFNPVLVDSGVDSPFTGAAGFYGADIIVGSLDVPYYLTAAAGVNDPTPLDSFWKGVEGSFLTAFNPTPVATSTQTIPVMVSVPKSPEPAGGYPVVIYQHGITTNRATMLAVADAFANLSGLITGYAVVAIDLPMHGLTGNETNGTEGFKTPIERTFDLDLVTQNADGDITASIPDGITDSSGRHFINLSNLLNSRDNLRQSVADLLAVYNAIGDLSVSFPRSPTALVPGLVDCNPCSFNPGSVFFLGHSLGAISGTVFTALEPGVQDAVFAFGGGGIAKILDGSATFGPSIADGLAGQGVVKGTPDYESFLGAAQTIIDSADAINYTTQLQANGEGILYFEIVGGAGSPSDLVVPNTVPDGNDTSNTVPAPLAGTEPILALLGLTQTNTPIPPGGADLQISVKYIAGEHSSLLDPTPAPAVTTQIQTQAATFIGTGGTGLPVADSSLIQAP
jgi:pimeloyl-ACP methyl ester carboxylesterase